MNRPTGVTILAWLAIIGGVIGVFGSIALIGVGIAAMSVGALGVAVGGAREGAAAAGAGIFAIIMGALLLVLALVEIVFGTGALGLKPWAWTVGVWWCYISAISNVIGLFSRGGLFSAVIGILIAVAILYYLFTDEVRAAFGKSDQAAPAFIVPVFLQINNMLANRGGGQQPPAPPAQTPPAPPAPPA